MPEEDILHTVIDPTAQDSDAAVDCRMASEGDGCPVAKCDGKLKSSHGIEVGHTFLLGRKYSEQFDATFADTDGTKKLNQRCAVCTDSLADRVRWVVMGLGLLVYLQLSWNPHMTS